MTRVWRKSTARTAIGDTLNDGEWWYVLDLIRATHIRAGLMYRVIGELEREGVVTAKWADLEPGRKHRRRLYRGAARLERNVVRAAEDLVDQWESPDVWGKFGEVETALIDAVHEYRAGIR